MLISLIGELRFSTKVLIALERHRKERRLDLENRAGWAPDEWNSLGGGQDGIRIVVLKSVTQVTEYLRRLINISNKLQDPKI